MSKLIDLTGRRYGRLLVLRREGSHWNDMGLHSTPTWRCRCDCGNEVVVIGYRLRGGQTRSCGCLHRDVTRERHERKREKRIATPVCSLARNDGRNGGEERG